MYPMTIDAARAEATYRRQSLRRSYGAGTRVHPARRSGWSLPRLHLGLHLRHS